MAEGRSDRAARRSPSLRTSLSLGVLVVVAVALRLPSIVTRSLWLDEAWLANLVLAPTWTAFVDEILGRTPGSVQVAPVPPLFAIALRLLAMVVGRSAPGLRLLPLAASVAAVLVAYVLAHRLASASRGRAPDTGRVAGLVAAACFACYPAVVLYGQELKPYATDVLTVLVLLACGERVLARPDAARPWVAFALVAGLVPGISYPAVLVLPGLALGLFAGCGDGRARRRWAIAHGAAVVAALGWWVAVIGAQRARPTITAYWQEGFAPATGAVGWVVGQIALLVGWLGGTPIWLFAALALAGVVCGPPRFMVTVGATLATVVGAALGHLYPLAVDRTSLYLAPLLYVPFGLATSVLAGAFATARPGRRLPAAAALGACVAVLAWPARGGIGASALLNREETAPLVAALAAERKPGDAIYVYCGAVPAFLFYGPTHGLAPGSDPAVVLGAVHRDDPTAYAAELKPLLVPGRRLWLLFAHAPVGRDGVWERDAILADVRLHAKEVAAREAPGAYLYAFDVERPVGAVRHLTLSPEDMRDPARVRELLRQQGGAPQPRASATPAGAAR